MVHGALEIGDFVKSVLDAMPSPIFIVDDDLRIMAANESAARMLSDDPALVIRTRAGEVLGCVHSTDSIEGCGRAEKCRECIVRNSVHLSLNGRQVIRNRATMERVTADGVSIIHLLVTAAPLDYQGEKLVVLVLEDISELTELRAILPICSNCKKIRNEDEYWENVENYLKEHLDVDLSHGLCPDCARKLYTDLFKPR
ncbi:MAG: PAS domain-containing protein [Desulfomonile tiedjei]|nr:PAS domain-containing protein [Desulfomonile tiedjei]